MISKKELERLYLRQRLSMKEIANMLGCVVHTVEYWMKKHGIPRRALKEAAYLKRHPKGDPFTFDPPKSAEDFMLFGIGIGLYWGEGTKANKYSIRLGNTDPELHKIFLKFLVRFFRIRISDFRFGLQLFTDIEPKKALDFWRKELNIHPRQFYKITVTPSGAIGTYRQKSKFGVLTIYYHNRKLRDALVHLLSHRNPAVIRKELAIAWGKPL